MRKCSPRKARALEDQMAAAGRVSRKLGKAGCREGFVALARSLGPELGRLESPLGPQVVLLLCKPVCTPAK